VKTIDLIKDALRNVLDPKNNENFVDLGYVKTIEYDSGHAEVHIEIPHSLQSMQKSFEIIIKKEINALNDVESLECTLSIQAKANAINAVNNGLAHVKNIIAVSSCKGGVGKSTTTVNLAFNLAKSGLSVGIFDADIYGPSLPTMIKAEDINLYEDGALIRPVEYNNIKLMSFGYAQNESQNQGPAILRGPMVSQIINQLLTNTNWGDLDYLLIDYPPGTGDVQLTLGQMIPITAAVIVTTPQHLSFIDVVKGIEMFDTLNIPTIAVVENMSYYVCKSCDDKHYIFGSGALNKLKKEFGFTHAFEFPLTTELSLSGDSGTPYILSHPESSIAQQYQNLADAVVEETEKINEGGIQSPEVGFDHIEGIIIQFNDTKDLKINSKTLRIECQCAHCVEEFTGKKQIDVQSIPDNVHPMSMNPVGNYALGINWSDGHSSLYPYERLKTLTKK
jgi:Mrp family chromosome partitioning ATPase/DUF971 family protein